MNTQITPAVDYTIDPGKLSLGSAFAEGKYSMIYHGTYDHKAVAVKIIRYDEDEEDQYTLARIKKQFNAEVTSLTLLHHQNIVKLVGACKEPPFRVITEYVSNGCLSTYLHKPKRVSLQELIKLALDIARGMEYVHTKGIIHKDLKSDNILIDEDLILKIADFGVSCEEKNIKLCKCCTGTYRWMAPEMINNKSYGRKVDVYSYGIILWELLTGTMPYKDLRDPLQVAYAVSQKNLRPDIPEDCPPPLRSLIERCWTLQPERRPEFFQIVKELELFESSISSDGTLQLVEDSTHDDHKKKGLFHFVQMLCICIPCRDLIMPHSNV